jgi:hypothetical protein
MFAPDAGRSKVSTQTPSSSISRRIIGAAEEALIRPSLSSFGENKSVEAVGIEAVKS